MRRDILFIIAAVCIAIVGFVIADYVYKKTGVYLNFKKIMAVTIMVIVSVGTLGMLTDCPNDEED